MRDGGRTDVAVERARRRGVHDPDRRARVRRHARVGLDDDRRRRGARRAASRARLHVRRRRGRRARRASSSPTSSRGCDALAPQRGVAAAMARALRNVGRPGRRRDGALGGRRRAVGPEGAAARRCRSSTLLGARARRGAGLRQRRLHLLLARRGSRSSSAAGSREGIPRVKMKVGREPGARPGARRAAREAIGDDAELFVDANGAYAPKQALALGRALRRRVGRHAGSRSRSPRTTSTGCGSLRDRAPAGLDVAAGEYALRAARLPRTAPAARSTACRPTSRAAAAITGVLAAGALAQAHGLAALGALRAAALAHALCASSRAAPPRVLPRPRPRRAMLFDGVLEPEDGGVLRPDRVAARARARAEAARRPTRHGRA